MKHFLKPILVYGTFLLTLTACSNSVVESESEGSVNDSNQTEESEIIVVTSETEENSEQVEEEFAIRFFDKNDNPITEFRLDEKFYVDITYPSGFVRTSFNLYEFYLMEAGRSISFASLMIPYSEFVEREDGISLAFMLESGEEMDMNIKFHADNIDEDGRLKFYGMVGDNSLFLPCTSDTISLLTK